jgi:hypothetical protein
MWRVSSKASLCHFPTLEAPIFCFSGALFVILNPTPNLKMLGLLQVISFVLYSNGATSLSFKQVLVLLLVLGRLISCCY